MSTSDEQISEITGQLCTTVYTFTTSDPHGYEIGDIVGFIAPEGVEINGSYFVLDVIDEYTFTVNMDSVEGSVTITVTINENDAHTPSPTSVWTSEIATEPTHSIRYTIPLPETYDYKLDADRGGELGGLTLSWTSIDGETTYENLVSDDTTMEKLTNGESIISSLIRGEDSTGTEVDIVGVLYNGTDYDSREVGTHETAANYLEEGESVEENITHAFDNRELVIDISDESGDGSGIYVVADSTVITLTFEASFAALDLSDVHLCTYNVSETPDPVEVYQDGSLLTIGVDYAVSIDNGSTYFTVWPADGVFSELYKSAKAGRFYIRFWNRDSSSIYWIKYRVHKNQSLSSCEQVTLRNGRVTFDEALKNTRGTLQSVIIARTNAMHPYVTPVLREYTLMVQEAKEDKSLSPSSYSGVDSSTESSQ